MFYFYAVLNVEWISLNFRWVKKAYVNVSLKNWFNIPMYKSLLLSLVISVHCHWSRHGPGSTIWHFTEASSVHDYKCTDILRKIKVLNHLYLAEWKHSIILFYPTFSEVLLFFPQIRLYNPFKWQLIKKKIICTAASLLVMLIYTSKDEF